MERLLDYRTIMHDENKENRMSCTVNVLVSESLNVPSVQEAGRWTKNFRASGQLAPELCGARLFPRLLQGTRKAGLFADLLFQRVCATVSALDVCTVVLPLVQKIRRSVLSCNQGAPSVITNPKWGVWVCFVLNTYWWLCWVFATVHGLFIAGRGLALGPVWGPLLLRSTGSRTGGLQSLWPVGSVAPAACGILVSRPGIQPVSPASQGGFWTPGPPRKSP